MIEVSDFNSVKGSSLIKGLTDSELKNLAAYCEKKQMAKGTTVFIENMSGESLFLIKKGSIRITKMFSEADEKTLIDLGAEDIFGEMAVIDGLPRSATARVIETVELITLRKTDFEKICNDKPELALKLTLNIVRIFSRRIREANEDYRNMLIWSMQTIEKS